MSMYRNRYFLLGVLLILLGVQFRMIDSFVLNERATRVLSRVTKSGPVANNSPMGSLMMRFSTPQMRRVEPPRWLGLAMIAVGSVVALHAVAIPRPS